MKHNKQKKDNAARWLVACKLPRSKIEPMKCRGFSRNEIFGFPTKAAALGFIKDVTEHNVECALAKTIK
ncbi:MAG: hypothetical protein EBR82_89305 [Caulobacteraceae bacterium]|nr:hypothetical protein [Caulobacteraceae bacterium]